MEKQIFLVRQEEFEEQAKLEFQVQAFGLPQNSEVEEKREAGVSMVEAQPEMGLSQNLRSVRAIPVPPRKHLPEAPLPMVPFRNK